VIAFHLVIDASTTTLRHNPGAGMGIGCQLPAQKAEPRADMGDSFMNMISVAHTALSCLYTILARGCSLMIFL
jgi:hypothetical protein